MYFILDENKKVIPCKNFIEWADFMERNQGTNFVIVKKDNIGHKEVSTVFIGLNYNNAPEVFETMVFNNGGSDHCERYSTYEEAMNGHERIVEMIKALDNGK